MRLSPLDSGSNFQGRRTKGQKRENPFFCPRINQCKSCVIGGNPVFIKSFSYLKMVLFHDELHSCPVVLFPMVYELHSQTFRFFADKRNILHIKSTHKYF